MARSRLVPVSDQLSIPRLELMAALTGVRLMEFVRQSLELSLGSRAEQWRYICVRWNPADFGTRGMSLSTLT